FALPKWLEYIGATCGVLAMQGGPITWVGHHRMHHAGSDTEKDPHDSSLGFWLWHTGWLFRRHVFFDDPKIIQKFARDLTVDPYYRWLERIPSQLLIQAIAAAVLFAIGGIGMVIWGIFVRLVFVYHVTWFVSSAAHMWGY